MNKRERALLRGISKDKEGFKQTSVKGRALTRCINKSQASELNAKLETQH